MKTDKVSFGTKTKIGITSAVIGLPKYNINLSAGIEDAFKKLSTNCNNDELTIKIGSLKSAKNYRRDTVEIAYWDGDGTFFQSSQNFSPKKMSKLTIEEVSNLILRTYENLKSSYQKGISISQYPREYVKSRFTSDKHKGIITQLVSKYGMNDWSCG